MTHTIERRCRCGNGLDVANVRTSLGVSSLGMCVACDTVQCPTCDKPSGVFASNRTDRCRHCGSRLGDFRETWKP